MLQKLFGKILNEHLEKSGDTNLAEPSSRVVNMKQADFPAIAGRECIVAEEMIHEIEYTPEGYPAKAGSI